MISLGVFFLSTIAVYFFFFFLLVSLASFSIHTELSKGPYTPIFFSLFELADKPN
jgi:hypothetical protein